MDGRADALHLVLKHWEPLSAGLAGWVARKVPERCQKGCGCRDVLVHVLGRTAMVLLAPDSKAHQGMISSLGCRLCWHPRVAGGRGPWQGDELSPTPSSQGCSWPAPSGWGCPSRQRVGPWITAGCPLLRQPRIPAAPGALAPLFFKQLLFLRENHRRETVSVWLSRSGAGEWPGSRWCDAYVAPRHRDGAGDS